MSKTQKTASATHAGIISITSKGVGYVAVPGFEEDVEIETHNLNCALHNDTVEIALLPRTRGRRQQGEVRTIVTRAKEAFVGVLKKENGHFFLDADDRRMYADILIPAEKAAEARDGDKAYVRMTKWNSPKKLPEGEIIKILGRKGEHNTEMESIVYEKGFETGFPKEVEEEAKRIKETVVISDAEIATRRDFRGATTFTIDPVDAKDFDDAVSIRFLENDTVEIGVHIADVSHYLRSGSKIDQEAAKRGTSIYLVDRTVPMLPEILSNDLCSLNPNEDKLTFSAVFIMTPDGQVVDRWFGRTVIHSDKRFTYEAAQEALTTKTGPYAKELLELNRLAYILREKRVQAGSINFETDEVKFELDEHGKPLRVYKKARFDAHLLIEDFMLLANKEVAEYIYKLGKGDKEKLFVYRIHDIPNQEKIEELALFLRAIGHELPVPKEGITAKDINALLNRIEGSAEEGLIKTATLRSMAKAVYTTRNVGHFGLAFEYYTHFTSPIRRYPDVMVHRLLAKHLAGEPIKSEEMIRVQVLSEQSTKREIAAMDAERSSIKYKQVEFMQDKIGQEFDGTISGVTEWGIYVEEAETKAEGMVKLRDLTDDYYELKAKEYALVGTRTRKKYSLGDKVRIRLIAADLEHKMLDWKIV